MEGIFGLVVLLVVTAPLMALALRRTAFGMVPGAVLLLGAIILIVTNQPVEDDVGGVGALGSGLQEMAGLAVAFFAVLAFVLGSGRRKAPAPAAPAKPRLPVARTHL